MRLVVAALTMVLALGSTALAQTVDLRAPDQQVAPTHQPVDPTDLRAPDQVAPAQSPLTTTDLRSPDQVAPAPPLVTTTDLRSPDQVAGPTSSVPTPVAADGGPAAIVFVLIGLGAALVLMAGGYLGVRYRHRVAIADDLVVD
jgi:hypothetical protein